MSNLRDIKTAANNSFILHPIPLTQKSLKSLLTNLLYKKL
jgi:hypothetical protein